MAPVTDLKLQFCNFSGKPGLNPSAFEIIEPKVVKLIDNELRIGMRKKIHNQRDFFPHICLLYKLILQV